MLNINPEIVCDIILRAREFHAKQGVDFNDEPLNLTDEDSDIQIFTEYEGDLTYQELKAAIDDLEPDQQLTLVALMWLGRGDFEKENWGNAIKEAATRRTLPTAEYLITTPLVADYLAEGLTQFGYNCEEPN